MADLSAASPAAAAQHATDTEHPLPPVTGVATAPVELPEPTLACLLGALAEAALAAGIDPGAHEPLIWWRGDGAAPRGIVGLASAAEYRLRSAADLPAAAAWFESQVDTIAAPHNPAPGLLKAFTSLPFDPEAGGGFVRIPAVTVVLQDGAAWSTVVEGAARPDGGQPRRSAGPPARDAPQRPPVADPAADLIRVTGDTAAHWRDLVAAAIGHIGDDTPDGTLHKVVIARHVDIETAAPIIGTQVAERLAAAYPSTWTYLVDGLVGATPELLVRRTGRQVASRVLAGTSARRTSPQGTAPDSPAPRDDALKSSAKDIREHAWASESVATALRPWCAALTVPEHPYVLELPNLSHLATDVTGELREDAATPGTLLRLLATLHPTAAVGGTPTAAALRVIRSIETAQRDRYAGPVGWIDARGDGELGIALRCAQISDDRRHARLWAGCGLVAGSDPDLELAETEAKLAPLRGALGLGDAP